MLQYTYVWKPVVRVYSGLNWLRVMSKRVNYVNMAPGIYHALC